MKDKINQAIIMLEGVEDAILSLSSTYIDEYYEVLELLYTCSEDYEV